MISIDSNIVMDIMIINMISSMCVSIMIITISISSNIIVIVRSSIIIVSSIIRLLVVLLLLLLVVVVVVSGAHQGRDGRAGEQL